MKFLNEIEQELDAEFSRLNDTEYNPKHGLNTARSMAINPHPSSVSHRFTNHTPERLKKDSVETGQSLLNHNTDISLREEPTLFKTRSGVPRITTTSTYSQPQIFEERKGMSTLNIQPKNLIGQTPDRHGSFLDTKLGIDTEFAEVKELSLSQKLGMQTVIPKFETKHHSDKFLTLISPRRFTDTDREIHNILTEFDDTPISNANNIRMGNVTKERINHYEVSTPFAIQKKKDIL